MLRLIRPYFPLSVVLSASLWFGCTTVGPDYTEPAPRVPDSWSHAVEREGTGTAADLRTWWKVLDDPVLDGLIERAAGGNLALRAAAERVIESRALLAIASGETVPRLDAFGGYQRNRASESTQPLIPDRHYNTYVSGLDSSWEIDFWGRIRRSVESAEANLEAVGEDRRDLLVTLCGEVAATYITAREWQQRTTYARANVESQKGTLELAKQRFKAGITPELDVRQAEYNLARTESAIPAMDRSYHAAVHRLGILLGESPGALAEELGTLRDLPGVSPGIGGGVPAELLRRRPDIRAAERRLAAQTARIGAAKANLYPTFSLSGTFALEALHSSEAFRWGSRSYGVGPSLRWNIFDGNRIRSAVSIEESRTRQALLAYEQTVLLALEEVENALVGVSRERERAAALQRSVTASAESVKLVDTLYRTGLTDFQNVLDMQRSLFQEQDRLVESRAEEARSLVALYKALGGGWDPDADVVRAPQVDAAE